MTTGLTGAPVPPILPPQDGYLLLDKARFRASFAADVDSEKASFMADSQIPWGVGALSGTISEPAWQTKPSWYLVATEDKMIPVANGELIASLIPGARLEILDGVGHMFWWEQPERSAELVRTHALGA